MIHIVTAENRHLYGSQLRAMHEARRRRGIGKNGEVDLAGLNGAEADDDDHRAISLLGLDDDMDLEVGLRLRPTDDHCVLADRFPHLIAPGETPKRGPEVWEVTRIFTTEACRERQGPSRGERMSQCWAAAFELGLRNGVTSFVGMIDMRLFPGTLNSPIDTRLVGIPRPYPQGVVAGFEIAVTQGVVDRVLEAIGRESPIGYEIDAWDMRAFGDLAAVQREVIRAMTPQLTAGAERDETLAAETLFRLHDTSGQARRIYNGRASGGELRRLDA